MNIREFATYLENVSRKLREIAATPTPPNTTTGEHAWPILVDLQRTVLSVNEDVRRGLKKRAGDK